MIDVKINGQEKSYPIFIESFEISKLKEKLFEIIDNKNFVIVISEKVQKLFGKTFDFNKENLFILKDGEKEKNFKNYQKILNFCLKKGLTREDYIVAIGGGVCVISFIACILGLFGNKIFVAVGVGVESMNFFNYMSIFTLIDTESMANFVKGQLGYEDSIFTPSCFNWIYECIAMLVGGALFSFIGMFRFKGKDLPL